ncbi:MAG: hypothetical protein ABWY05_15800 [Noviherbaspirillum sp.]
MDFLAEFARSVRQEFDDRFISEISRYRQRRQFSRQPFIIRVFQRAKPACFLRHIPARLAQSGQQALQRLRIIDMLSQELSGPGIG